MMARQVLRASSVALAAGVALAVLTASMVTGDEVTSLGQVMSQAVEKASPAVVRVLIPEDAAKARRPGAPRRPAAPDKAEEPSEKTEQDEAKGTEAKDPAESDQQNEAPDKESAEPEKNGTDGEAAPEEAVKTIARTGLILSADGYLITSLLSVGNADEGLKVELSDGRVLPAQRLGEDVRRDVVLLKIDGENLPAAEAAPISEVVVGQWVLAVGRTLSGPGPTVSKGIISAQGRLAGVALQTDASISAMNYGGPLIDIRGRVVGMIAALGSGGSSARAEQFSDSGIGFVVPLEDILAELPELKEGRRIEPPFLGIGYNWGRLEEGAQIHRVIPGTAAAECGVKRGDVIIEFDGVKVASPFQIGHLIGSHKVGDQVTFKVVRGEQTLTLSGTLKARPEHIRE